MMTFAHGISEYRNAHSNSLQESSLIMSCYALMKGRSIKIDGAKKVKPIHKRNSL